VEERPLVLEVVDVQGVQILKQELDAEDDDDDAHGCVEQAPGLWLVGQEHDE